MCHRLTKSQLNRRKKRRAKIKPIRRETTKLMARIRASWPNTTPSLLRVTDTDYVSIMGV